MTALPTDLTARLGKLLPMLSSHNTNEVTATVAGIGRVLASANRDWNDLAQHVAAPAREIVRYVEKPPEARRPADYGDWRRTYRDLDPRRRQRAQVSRVRAAPIGFLSPWEAEFVGSLGQQLDQGRNLSCRQETILRNLFARLEERFG